MINQTKKKIESHKTHRAKKPVEGGSSRRAVKPRRTPSLIPKESDEQKALAVYLNMRFGENGWVHVPNEMTFLKFLRGALPKWLFEKIKFMLMNFMKAIGVKKDFPDILIFVRPEIEDGIIGAKVASHYGMAIELKRQKGGRLSPGQKAYLEYFDSIGWATAVAYGAQDAITKIEEVYGK